MRPSFHKRACSVYRGDEVRGRVPRLGQASRNSREPFAPGIRRCSSATADQALLVVSR